ncbi:MAG: tyrosine--tRNA ligase [Candidatus Moranbacteria bacterium]|jgi:tyrosyl-tRNA synthetase|nr:tyrosine--tRNA ligase [Candidatus Moranbacteria bacterium]
MKDEQKIKELLERGVAELIGKDNLEKRLKSGEKLRIKHGADPTAPDLHLGHSVVLKKLKEFQELGHKIVFIIGDFTAKIGDPSGRTTTRPVLSDKEIKNNAKTYFQQVGKILDIKKTEIHYNGEWFSKEGWKDVLELTGKFSLHRILERDDFEKRIESGAEISAAEILYPIMQAYDSVKIKADIEIGGTDQKFNMLAGRTLQRRMNMAEQYVITIPLLIGTDGEKKMSKSLGNYVGITEKPETQYGKIMSIPDKLLPGYFNLLINLNFDGKENPRDAKMRLAFEIVKTYHSEKEAKKAQENFINLFQKKEIPSDIPEIKIKKEEALGDILVENKIISSKSEFRRLLAENAIDVDEKTITDVHHKIEKNAIIKIGKRKFIRIILN